MDSDMLQAVIDERLKVSLEGHKTELLTSMESTVEKISGNSNIQQINEITSIVNGNQIFKNKKNEEQFTFNCKVTTTLDEAQHLIQSRQKEERSKIAEAKESIAHRQKLIRLADSYELGWRLVTKYESNPLASDSDDKREMYKAEARVSRKLKAERAKKPRGARAWPYRRQAVPATTVQSTEPQQPARRPGLCFACGNPGHWKGAPECSAKYSNNKISSC